MICLFEFNKISDTDWEVLGKHYKPLDPIDGMGKTQEELEAGGYIFVDTIPDYTSVQDKTAILHINPTTKELWYTYVDIPKTEEEILKERIATLETHAADTDYTLMMGGLL